MNVCRLDAIVYCGWLREMTGIPYRLPTQAEWEYACTAGGKEWLDGRALLEQVAWYKANRLYPEFPHICPAPVGSKQPNSFGLYDMLGNVWEWCLDGPDAGHEEALGAFELLGDTLSWKFMLGTSHEHKAASKTLFAGKYALRGGAYCEKADRTNSVFRMFYPGNYLAERVGLRIAYSAPTKGNETGPTADPPKVSNSLPVVFIPSP